jgi:glutamate---cysteine ligase / carboxylate-amine ligase
MGEEQRIGYEEMLAQSRASFDSVPDFTVAVEEEFALLDPETLSLVNRFEELQEAAQGTELEPHLVGELIASEVEVRTGRCDSFADAVALVGERRQQLRALAEPRGIALGATGTHPWSDYREQHNIDTEHYRRVVEGLQYVARRNNTFSLHVHVGVRGAERAVRVCDRLRPVLPELLALSANSPFLDGRLSGLHSARTQIFTKSFPRCGIPDPFGGWAGYADYVDYLIQTNSIVEQTQIWWSVRPHHSFGTVELRICDAQTSAADSTALEALITACIAQAAIDEDERVPFDDPPANFIEENFWRAIRYGLEGKLIDIPTRTEFPAAAVAERLLDWTGPARAELGIDPALPAENGAQRQRRALEEGATMEDVYAAEVAETQRTYAAEEVSA